MRGSEQHALLGDREPCQAKEPSIGARQCHVVPAESPQQFGARRVMSVVVGQLQRVDVGEGDACLAAGVGQQELGQQAGDLKLVGEQGLQSRASRTAVSERSVRSASPLPGRYPSLNRRYASGSRSGTVKGMCAALIFTLARVMRCPMAASMENGARAPLSSASRTGWAAAAHATR